jgi:hypothetical protein
MSGNVDAYMAAVEERLERLPADPAVRIRALYIEMIALEEMWQRRYPGAPPIGGQTIEEILQEWAASEAISTQKKPMTARPRPSARMLRLVHPAPKQSEPGPVSARKASEAQIHAAIAAVNDTAKAAGEKVPNVRQVVRPVQAALRTQGLAASTASIRTLAADKRYARQRGRRW